MGKNSMGKNFLYTLLVFLLALSFVSCGSGRETQSGAPDAVSGAEGQTDKQENGTGKEPGEAGLNEAKKDETETKPQEMEGLPGYTMTPEGGDWEFANESIFVINNKMSFEEIRETTEGKYWNHIVNGNNTYADFLKDNHDNSYAYYFSTKRCTNHGVACPQNGTMDCNAYNGKAQCKGFAFMLASILYDEDPDTWNFTTDINDIKAGDILVYEDGGTEYGHTVFVIGVNGSEITIAEANYAEPIYGNTCMVKWGRVLYKYDITLRKIHVAPKDLTEVIKNYDDEDISSETIVNTLSPGNYHIVASKDGCPYRIVSTNGCVASYIAYNNENTFRQVVYKENIDSEFMESFGTSGIDVTIEEGQMEIISLWNETEEEKSELFVSDLGHPAVFGKTLNVGDSLIIENEYYNGHIGSNSVIVHGKAVTSVNKVRTTRTDYWWNRYMGWEIEETSFEESITSFYTYCESCNIIEYTVLEGEVKIFVKYDDKNKLTFNPE